ncbi:MAG: hypothetical protein AAF800_09275, partial [Planctomycetota bacterium]
RHDPDGVAASILDQARAAYRKREVTYPVEFTMQVISQGAQQDQKWAVEQIKQLMKTRYLVDVEEQDIVSKEGPAIYQMIMDEQQAWLAEGGKLRQEARERAAKHRADRAGLADWLKERYGVVLEDGEIDGVPEDQLEDFVYDKGHAAFVGELTRLERFVLLQILDKAWKDHLYAMDQVKDSVGLRGYAEKDPRIEYKREGAAQFQDMQRSTREQVTDLIFRARLTPNVRLQNAYGDQQQAEHPDAAPGSGPAPGVAAAAASAAAQGSADQRAANAVADRAGTAPDRAANLSRKQRRAAEARQRHQTHSGPKKQRRRKGR